LYYCLTISYEHNVLTLYSFLSIREGDFHAACKAHFKSIRKSHPDFGSTKNRGIIDKFAPNKVAACKALCWNRNPEHCQWITVFGCGTSLYLLRTKEVTELTWTQVVLGKEKYIEGLIGRRTVRIITMFDKTHECNLQSPTARRDLRGSNHDAVEDIKNPNCFVKAFHQLRTMCPPDATCVFTLKCSKKHQETRNKAALGKFYFDDRTSRALGENSILGLLEKMSGVCGFENPADGKPTFNGCRHLVIMRMASNGVTASESITAAHHKSLDVHTV
jgi:hypothetical protein